MTVERRLRDALHEVDHFAPSVDLFARVKRSVAEDARFRRRRFTSVLMALGVAGIMTVFLATAVRRVGGLLVVDTWRLVVADLALAGALVVTMAPNIRRFAGSYVDDVFHLSPVTGGRFLAVLDVAYYLFFAGMALVDLDQWDLDAATGLASGLEMLAERIAFLALAMGVLHALNIAALPVLGLIFNSTMRDVARSEAGPLAPPVSPRARQVAGNTRGIVVAIVVLAACLAFVIVITLLGGGAA
jgi:hypothetical protein